MRHYECQCVNCGNKKQIAFSQEPYPQIGEYVINYCKNCKADTSHTRTITHKAVTELRQKENEQFIRNAIIAQCNELGFSCRFVIRSVVITTPLADWCFDYHQTRKTLYHESTIKINFATGNYSKSHRQFVDKKMTVQEVIDYIAKHDAWRASQMQK